MQLVVNLVLYDLLFPFSLFFLIVHFPSKAVRMCALCNNINWWLFFPMQYKALPWLRVCTFGLGAQSANLWIRDWNVRNAIIEVLVLRNPRTCPTPPPLGGLATIIMVDFLGPSLVPRPLPAAILKWVGHFKMAAGSDLGTRPGSQSDYARCEVCTGKMEVPRSAVCSCSVANPSFCRRIE